jgi:hypothetical protein
MILQQVIDRKKDRGYIRYRLLLTKKEGLRISPAGTRWEIFDVDPKGELILHSPKRFDYHYSKPKPTINTSFRLHVSQEEWQRFRELSKSRATSVCEVLSAFVRGVLANEDSLLEPKGVQLIFNYQGRPRGRNRSLITVTPSGISGPVTSGS